MTACIGSAIAKKAKDVLVRGRHMQQACMQSISALGIMWCATMTIMLHTNMRKLVGVDAYVCT